MKPIIINKLKEIEDKYNIEILFAVESGSRAWGFPSTDSDYDVRFIYKRKIEDYLKVDPIDDFIDLEIVDELDFKGWDIQKVLRLMLKSNSSINEYLQSPIHYISNEIFEKELLDEEGMLIVEHSKYTKLEHLTNFSFAKIYGGSVFSFYEFESDEEEDYEDDEE